jgi:hypothetical protein
MQIALIVVAAYALLVSVLWWLFPRNTIVVHHQPANVKALTDQVGAELMRRMRTTHRAA